MKFLPEKPHLHLTQRLRNPRMVPAGSCSAKTFPRTNMLNMLIFRLAVVVALFLSFFCYIGCGLVGLTPYLCQSMFFQTAGHQSWVEGSTPYRTLIGHLMRGLEAGGWRLRLVGGLMPWECHALSFPLLHVWSMVSVCQQAQCFKVTKWLPHF